MAGVTTTGVDANRWYPSGFVARLYGVDPRTIARWWKAGKLSGQMTLGGRLRFRGSEVLRLIGAGLLDQQPPAVLSEREVERRAMKRLAELL